ncbi:hypothetical protein [Campylobacter sp.]|uniref:hypothetical protein n=1 Tax=Campylobacter sp. TaxID=205 RepID=UPI002AA64AFA|nr:hypothetical protein [Campylobacter sp.]
MRSKNSRIPSKILEFLKLIHKKALRNSRILSKNLEFLIFIKVLLINKFSVIFLLSNLNI